MQKREIISKTFEKIRKHYI